MSTKLTNPTITKLAKTFHLSYGEGLENWFLLYSDIFSQLPQERAEQEVRRGFFKPIFLDVQENDTLKMGKFINNFSLLWSVISQYVLPSDLTAQKLMVVELRNETVKQDYLLYETLELIQRHTKVLDPHLLYHKLVPLIDNTQCQRCFNRPKFTQDLFYQLIGISTATAHNKKLKGQND